MSTRAILINVGVYNADSGVRRNVGQYRTNYLSDSGSFVTNSLTVAATQSLTLDALNPAKVTVLRVSAPVTCSFLMRDDVTTLEFAVGQLLLVDFDFKSLTITAGSADTSVELHQT